MMKIFLVFGLIGILLLSVSCTSTTTAARSSRRQQEEPEKIEAVEEVAVQQEQQQLSIEEMSQEFLKEYSYGYERFANKLFPEALEFFNRALKYHKRVYSYPDNMKYQELYFYIGEGYKEIGKPDSTLLLFEEGVNFGQKESTERYMRSYITYTYFTKNQIDKYIPAVEALLPLLETDAEKIENLENLRDILQRHNRDAEALEVIERMLVIDPDNLQFQQDRLDLVRLVKGEGAIRAEFEAKLEKDPTDKDIMLELISIYERNEEYELLIQMIDKYLAVDPNDATSVEKKVEALRKLDRPNEAIEALKVLSALRPEEPRYLTDIAAIYIALENYRQAIASSEQALRVRSGYGEAHFQIAMAIKNVASIQEEKDTKKTVDVKVVNEIALYEFQEAAKDPNVKTKADRWIPYLKTEGFTMTGNDWFMQRSYRFPEDAGLKWLDPYYKKYESKIKK
ncbi:hypothetical protein ACFL6L_04440 [candidate division KSB1 bacterium]